jgi:hypothetical protein
MTSQGPGTPDEFDAFERRLASRVTRHADHGVRPIDAAAIAHHAAAGGRAAGGLGAGARFLGRAGWLLAGAALAAGAIGGAAWAGSHGLLGIASTSPLPSLVAFAPSAAPVTATASTGAPSAPPVVTAAPTQPAVQVCHVSSLAARVTAWTGAAGNRVATVVLTNNGSSACHIQSLERPQLVDGNSSVLIDGTDPSRSTALTIDAGASVSTMVDDANYCGPRPKAPVTVAFVFSSGLQLVASPRSATDTFGAPECMGAGAGGDITMHPWAP